MYTITNTRLQLSTNKKFISTHANTDTIRTRDISTQTIQDVLYLHYDEFTINKIRENVQINKRFYNLSQSHTWHCFNPIQSLLQQGRIVIPDINDIREFTLTGADQHAIMTSSNTPPILSTTPNRKIGDVTINYVDMKQYRDFRTINNNYYCNIY